MSDEVMRVSAPDSVPRRRLICGLGLALMGCAEPYIVSGGPVYAPDRPDRPLPPGPRPVATLDVEGRVEVLQGGRNVLGRDGMPVYRGDEVRTVGSSYARCRFNDGDTVWLDFDTRVRVGSMFTYFGRVFASVSGIFQVDSEFVAASSEGTEFTVTIGRRSPDYRVAVRRGVVLCQPRKGNWRALRLRAGERLIGAGVGTPRIDRLDGREGQDEFGWVPGMERAPDLRLRERPPVREHPTTPPAPPQSTPPASPPSPPATPRSRGIIDRLERAPAPPPPPPREPVIR